MVVLHRHDAEQGQPKQQLVLHRREDQLQHQPKANLVQIQLAVPDRVAY